MIPEPIENARLAIDDVPDAAADWDAIQRFALTYNGYQANGSFEACAVIANEQRHTSLDDLRTCLFFEQRRWHHFGDEPDAGSMTYIRSLIEKIQVIIQVGDGNGRV